VLVIKPLLGSEIGVEGWGYVSRPLGNKPVKMLTIATINIVGSIHSRYLGTS
jgi:hypothetical protein